MAKLRTKAGDEERLSEGPEVGRDSYLLLRAKHSLNQQKQETLPWQTAAEKDGDTVRDTEQKETFIHDHILNWKTASN